MTTARALALAVALLVSGCRLFNDPGTGLRIHNAGSSPIAGLTVLFPNDEISFGDVGAGATTGYRSAKGVYGYGAYRFVNQGKTVLQPVIDWVGEAPLDGHRFTYTIALVPIPNGDPRIELRDVKMEE